LLATHCHVHALLSVPADDTALLVLDAPDLQTTLAALHAAGTHPDHVSSARVHPFPSPAPAIRATAIRRESS